MLFFKNTKHLSLLKATVLSLALLLATFSFFVKASAPTILSIAPSSGSQSGGDTVTITGTDFLTAPSVMFGGNPSPQVILQSNTVITAKVPVHAAGKVNVTVINTDGQFAVVIDAYTYNYPPTIASISPNTGTTAGGDIVMMKGANFFGIPTVLFGDSIATNVTFDGEDSLSLTTPAHSAGLVDITLANPDGQSTTLVAAFTFSGGEIIDASVIPVDFSGEPVSTPVAGYGTASSTETASSIGTATTKKTTTIVNNYSTLSNLAPTITAVSPSSGNRFGGDSVTITGTNFTATPVVTFGGINAISTIYQSSTTLVVVTPAERSVWWSRIRMPRARH